MEPSARPKIGVPRLYATGESPVVYPGECAISRVTAAALDQALQDAARTGARRVNLSFEDWLVAPAPGWYAWYLRWRWRVIGRWFASPPKLETGCDPSRLGFANGRDESGR